MNHQTFQKNLRNKGRGENMARKMNVIIKGKKTGKFDAKRLKKRAMKGKSLY